MTERQKHLYLSQTQNNISLHQYRSFEDFQLKKQGSVSPQRKVIKFSPENQKQELERLQWRKKTEFPIVKVLNFKKLNKDSFSSQKSLSKKVLVEIVHEPILYTLQEVDQIPIFKVFYLLKQTLIATERLCTFYGNFVLKSNMVGIDPKRKCKIWHNSEFHSSKPQFSCHSQQQSVKSIVDLFSCKTKKSLKSVKFYSELQKSQTFCDCLLSLKNFATQSHVQIPSSFVIVDQFSSNMCSPRKYISRPPSSQKNPESPETKFNQKIKTSKHESPKLNQSQAWKFSKLTFQRPKINSFTSFKTASNGRVSSPFAKNVPLTQRNNSKNCFNKRINQTQYQQSEVTSKNSLNKKITFLHSKNQKIFQEVQSILQSDSDYTSLDSFHDRLRIRLLEPVIKQQDEQFPQNTILYRSSISTGECDIKQNQTNHDFKNTNLQTTDDEPIFSVKREKITRAFQSLMKLIDQSFEDSHRHHY